MKRFIMGSAALLLFHSCPGWGFFAHKKINEYAVYLLPPQMLVLYKQQVDFLSEHAVDPDKRRYALTEEGPRHYIDLDHYGKFPFTELPRNWNDAVEMYTEDSLNKYGVVPWWLQVMMHRLTEAFRTKNQVAILKLSADIGHYIADAHVPLHTTRNHNGQYTNQKGIHGFWESRIPELLAEKEWDFFIGPAIYITDQQSFFWNRILESATYVDTVLNLERQLTSLFAPDRKYAFEERNGIITRQYSSAFSRSYDRLLKGMIEKRMRQSIHAVASCWYTAWINAGQPDLRTLSNKEFSAEELSDFENLNRAWKLSGIKGREHE